ncbi:putative vinorine synthase [Helianthus annuus]|nr:putative vinorine synthase [Helianthus annuus]KAJ0748113.1 putative vinorine synthase [Helianthus annuus]
MKVTVISKELIVPSSPTPHDLKTYKFSFIDQQIPPYYIPLILYYSYDDQSTTTTQSQITIKLKTSLSKTLTHFYPLAGRLTSSNNTVDCTDQGVQFLVARVESNLFDITKSPKIDEMNKLVKVESSYVEDQLAIQVNLFDCGGIAVGVSMSHRIGDACSISSFVSHWFALAKGSQTPMPGPVLDSAVLFPPVDSCAFSRNPKDPTVPVPFETLVTKRFVFSSLAISKLKSKVVKELNTTTTLVDPTRVEVVTSLIWKCGTMALGDCEVSVAFHSVNLRRKMGLQDHQFGNLFQLANAVAHRTEEMASRVVKLRDSFSKIDGEYAKSLMGEKGFEIARGNFKEIRKFIIQEGVGVFKFGSWCGFGFSESDFGWGKPVYVGNANFSDENSIVLMDSRKDDGIEAYVVMNKDNMHKFEENDELQEFVGSTTLTEVC